ncbi:MAG: hypothetical protein Tsb0013_14730 [Phycisphaerales bacterium]
MMGSTQGVAGDVSKARVMQVVVGGALAMGVVLLTVMGLALGGVGSQPPGGGASPGPASAPGIFGIDPGYELLFMIAGAMVLAMVPASFVVRVAMTPKGEMPPEERVGPAMSAFILGAAMCEGPALFGGVIVLLSGQVYPPVLVVGLGLAGILLHIALPVVRRDDDPNFTAYNVGR